MLLMKEKKLFPRVLLPKLEKWIDRREAFAIKGPRQSGKTTLLRILDEKLADKGNVVFLNFEDPDVLEAFEANPKRYVESFMPKRGKLVPYRGIWGVVLLSHFLHLRQPQILHSKT